MKSNDFNPLPHVRVDAGNHKNPQVGHCIMEIAGFVTDEFTDDPRCASYIVRMYALALNDIVLHDDRQKLLPYALRIATSAEPFSPEGIKIKVKRMLVAADFALDVVHMTLISERSKFAAHAIFNQYLPDIEDAEHAAGVLHSISSSLTSSNSIESVQLILNAERLLRAAARCHYDVCVTAAAGLIAFPDEMYHETLPAALSTLDRMLKMHESEPTEKMQQRLIELSLIDLGLQRSLCEVTA